MQTTINIISSILAILFIILLIRTFSSGKFKGLWSKAKANQVVELNKQKSLEKGYREYPHECGRVMIYAKNSKDAQYQYNHFRKTQK